MSKSKLTEAQLLELITTYEGSISKLKYQISVFESTIKDLKANLKETRAANKAAAKKSASTTKKSAAPAAKKTTARRGRPKKTTTTAAETKKTTATKSTATKSSTPVAKKPAARRGRPPKNAAAKTTTNGKAPAKSAARSTPKAKATSTAKKPAAKKVAAKTSAKSAPKVTDKRGYKLSDWDQFILTSVETANRVLTRSEIDEMVSKKGGTLKKGMEAKQITAKVSNVLHKLTNKRGILKKDKNAENKSGYTLA